ncbi:MAG: TlyA family RNA methyltransferase, partial [Lachnospiraceae bacterium]|nr:TlyA family RNA methyltransferase [Lachnospiraceae bacterium]
EKVGKKGVVRDKKVHLEVIEKVLRDAEENGFYPYGLTFSPVKGPEGNIEYLIYMGKEIREETFSDEPESIVDMAHETLKG